MTTSPSGREQQIRALPAAGGMIGIGPVADRPGHEPRLRRCDRLPRGTPISSARRRLRRARAGSDTPLPNGHSRRSERTKPAGPCPKSAEVGAAAGAERLRFPGCWRRPGRRASLWIRRRATPQSARPAVSSLMKAAGPQRKKSASRGASSSRSDTNVQAPGSVEICA